MNIMFKVKTYNKIFILFICIIFNYTYASNELRDLILQEEIKLNKTKNVKAKLKDKILSGEISYKKSDKSNNRWIVNILWENQALSKLIAQKNIKKYQKIKALGDFDEDNNQNNSNKKTSQTKKTGFNQPKVAVAQKLNNSSNYNPYYPNNNGNRVSRFNNDSRGSNDNDNGGGSDDNDNGGGSDDNDNGGGSDDNDKSYNYKLTTQGCDVRHYFVDKQSKQQVRSYHVKEGNTIYLSECLDPEEFPETNGDPKLTYQHYDDVKSCSYAFINNNFFRQTRKFIESSTGKDYITNCEPTEESANSFVLIEKDFSSCNPILDYYEKTVIKRFKNVAKYNGNEYTLSSCQEDPKIRELIITNQECIIRNDFTAGVVNQQERYAYRDDDGTINYVSDCFDSKNKTNIHKIEYTELTCDRDVDPTTNLVVINVRPYYNNNAGVTNYIGDCQPSKDTQVLTEEAYTIHDQDLLVNDLNESDFIHDPQSSVSYRKTRWIYYDYEGYKHVYQDYDKSNSAKFTYAHKTEQCGYQNNDTDFFSYNKIRKFIDVGGKKIYASNCYIDRYNRIPYVNTETNQVFNRNDDNLLKTFYDKEYKYKRPDSSLFIRKELNTNIVPYSIFEINKEIFFSNDDSNLRSVYKRGNSYKRDDGSIYDLVSSGRIYKNYLTVKENILSWSHDDDNKRSEAVGNIEYSRGDPNKSKYIRELKNQPIKYVFVKNTSSSESCSANSTGTITRYYKIYRRADGSEASYYTNTSNKCKLIDEK